MKPLLFTYAMFFLCSSVNAQVDTLTTEQQKLSFIAGSWTIDGNEETYIETCDWIQGNHLQCLSTENEDGKDRKSISYFTYSATEKVYIYYGLYSGGGTRTLRGSWVEDRFIFEGQQRSDDGLKIFRVTMKPDHDKIHFVEEQSTVNGEWKEIANFHYKPAM